MFSVIKFNLLYLFIILAIINTILQINIELDKDFYTNLNAARKHEERLFDEINKYESIGWFNLDKYENYDKGADFVFVSFQNVIVPTILENYGYNKVIICYYTSIIQLAAFCKKNKKYRLVRKDILTNFALLERID